MSEIRAEVTLSLWADQKLSMGYTTSPSPSIRRRRGLQVEDQLVVLVLQVLVHGRQLLNLLCKVRNPPVLPGSRSWKRHLSKRDLELPPCSSLTVLNHHQMFPEQPDVFLLPLHVPQQLFGLPRLLLQGLVLNFKPIIFLCN